MTSKEEKLIKRHEGYRSALYRDTRGILTGGYGHAFRERSVLPLGVWEDIWVWDYSRARAAYNDIMVHPLDKVRQAVLVDMCFNLGLRGLLEFTKMLRAVRMENWQEAAAEMRASEWHNQVGNRAVELEEMMLTGKWPKWMEADNA